MSSTLTMPRMGETMETGRIAAWLKQPGESFVRGETILEIETDKTTVEVPALDSGRLTEILAPEGAELAVGEPVGRYDAIGGKQPDAALAPAPEAVDPLPESPAPKAAPSPAASNRHRATPVARRLARVADISLAALAGSGRRGRIERRDVEAALSVEAPAPDARPSLPDLQFLSLSQGRMAYREWTPPAAASRTLLLLHGFSADSTAWASLASGLARNGVRVIVPDLPGHGATEIGAPGFDGLLAATAAFAQVLDLQEAELAGHSMGGALAVRLAATRQIDPAALTLLAPAGLGGEIDADFIHGIAAAHTGGAIAHLLRRLARKPPQLSRSQLDAMARELARERLGPLAADLAPSGRQGIDIVPDLAALHAPMRIIWGLDDRILPWTQIAAAPSRAAIYLIANAGHMPLWDQPGEVAARLA